MFEKKVLFICLLLIIIQTSAAFGINIIIDRFPSSSLFLQIGSLKGGSSTVEFIVTGVYPEDKGARQTEEFITASETVDIQLSARGFPMDGRPALLFVDSSKPMASGDNAISFENISWESSNPLIPSGSFNGSDKQLIATLPTPVVMTSAFKFRFRNDKLYSPGQYSGRVIFTLMMP